MKPLIKLQRISGIIVSMCFALIFSLPSIAQVTFEEQYKVSDLGLYFNGTQTKGTSPNANNPDVMDYAFGPRISAHGDAIKVYEEFIFTTWYKGGKSARNLMLSRYNTQTGVLKTIQFPHKHTGFRGDTLIGESHNTAAVGISPKDGKIHILYDMHSYNNTQFPGDYFRYSFSQENAATVSDADFKLDIFVADRANDYGHNNLNGTNDVSQFSDLTYPTFFLNEDNDLLFYMRTGGNNNGGYVFTKYNSSTGDWNDITQFNHLNAKTKSNNVDYNWGLYGDMKYVNGKLRTAFQKRSANNDDKYQYQNGIYYAYSNDQSGKTQWKNHKGQGFNIPFADPSSLKIYEPGNLVPATGANQVYIVGGFDFTVTNNDDVHIVSMVKDKTTNQTVKLHSYKPNGANDFTHTTDFTGGSSLYTSGEYVYIIGLKAGRPFIQRARGGTNNFTTVYEDTDGQSFAHGVLTIHEGKVYYFLQENKFENYIEDGEEKRRLSTKMPLYVQVIDLDIEAVEEPEVPVEVDYTPPEGFTLAADATQTIAITGTMDVAFGANGQFNYKYNQTEDLVCNRDVFGDPLLGVVKKCFTKSVIVDEYCSVADTRWSVAQEKFAQVCSDFVFEKCEATTSNFQEWIVCSSRNTPLDYIVIVDDSEAVRVQAEDYSRAIDVSIDNKGEQYRPGDVDIEATTDMDGGYQVAWINPADSLSYDILVSKAGKYELKVRSANPLNDITVMANINDTQQMSAQLVPSTSSETVYESTTYDLGELEEGSQVLTLIFSGDIKFNWFQLNYVPDEDDVTDPDSPEPEPEYAYGKFAVENNAYQVDEFTSTLDIEITRIEGSDQTLELEYRLTDGTAVAAQDYQLAAQVLTFADGETSKWITIDIIDDFEYELEESFTLEFIRQSQEAEGELLGDIVITIIDNEPAPAIGDFGFEFESLNVNEQDGDVTVTVLRTNGLDGQALIDVQFEHVSSNDSDVDPVSTTLTFADQEASKTLILNIKDDEEVESLETFKLTLSSLNTDILFTQKELLVEIESDDQAMQSIAFAQNTLSVDEGKNVDIQINREGLLLNKTYQVQINAQSTVVASDYNLDALTIEFEADQTSQVISLSVLEDNEVEASEILILDLMEANETEGSEFGVSQILSKLTITVNNTTVQEIVESGIVEISGVEFEVNESASEIEIQLMRYSGLASNVIVDVAVQSSQAIEGEDYTWVNQTITFAENQSTQSVFITILDDEVFENEESLTLNISLNDQNTNDAIIGLKNQATIKIIDNDTQSVSTLVKFANESLTLEEGEMQTIQLVRQGDLSEAISVSLGIESVLTSAVHYELSNIDVEFAVNQSQAEINLTTSVGSAINNNQSEIVLSILENENYNSGNALVIDITASINSAPENETDTPTESDNANEDSKLGSVLIWWLGLLSLMIISRRAFRN